MPKRVRTKIPMVEVTAPDGQKSLWIAAVAKANAVAAVKQVVPPNYGAALSERRLMITRKSEVLWRGEVRRVKLSPDIATRGSRSTTLVKSAIR